MARIIISGASGFLGTNIIKIAQEQGIDIIAITLPGELQGIVKTITLQEFLSSGIKFVSDDVFINCLFPTNADGNKMAEGLDVHFRVISKAHQCGIHSFINISSQSVYPSKRQDPANEDNSLSLETPYAVGKYCSEKFVNEVFKGTPHSNIRLASLLGIGYDQRIVNRMIIQALQGAELKVIGGMQRYGFLDVRDAATALVKMTQSNPQMWKETYNLGRKESYSLIDVVECICLEVKRLTNQDTTYAVSEGEDHRNSAINPSRFMKDFEWDPMYSLSKTTADIIESKYNKAG